ncbi:hypothetical protein HJFPF1_12323 [Paramyrothecium foliicola]|nr:hypothetical protein HJFPF1_12323 [Paramyrothecium foliicola]
MDQFLCVDTRHVSLRVRNNTVSKPDGVVETQNEPPVIRRKSVMADTADVYGPNGSLIGYQWNLGGDACVVFRQCLAASHGGIKSSDAQQRSPEAATNSYCETGKDTEEARNDDRQVADAWLKGINPLHSLGVDGPDDEGSAAQIHL